MRRSRTTSPILGLDAVNDALESSFRLSQRVRRIAATIASAVASLAAGLVSGGAAAESIHIALDGTVHPVDLG